MTWHRAPFYRWRFVAREAANCPGSITLIPRVEGLMSSYGISVGNVFLLSPTTATYWCCAADDLALTVPNVALYTGEMAVNPVKGGSCNSVYDKQDLL